MQGWHTPYLGLRDLPRELSAFELQAFFTFSCTERELIDRRRGDHHKLGLALHIGFVRMSGRPLNSVRAVPAALLRHLGQTLDIQTSHMETASPLSPIPLPLGQLLLLNRPRKAPGQLGRELVGPGAGRRHAGDELLDGSRQVLRRWVFVPPP